MNTRGSQGLAGGAGSQHGRVTEVAPVDLEPVRNGLTRGWRLAAGGVLDAVWTRFGKGRCPSRFSHEAHSRRLYWYLLARSANALAAGD